MNRGSQRFSATPRGADTTTCPAGEVIPGKPQKRKDLTRIMAAHGIPYVAQASPSHWLDLMKKVRKALEIKGPKFINIISPFSKENEELLKEIQAEIDREWERLLRESER